MASTQADEYRLLIADDEPVAREFLSAILRATGYTAISEATTGEEALTALRRSEFHLIFLDHRLPDRNGLEVLRQGKQLQPNAEFILVTAYGSLPSVIAAIDLGAFSYITKPFLDVELVAGRVARALTRVSARLENAALLQKIREVLADLERAEAELCDVREVAAPPSAREIQLVGDVRRAVEELHTLASRLGALREKVKGSAAKVIASLGEEVVSLAELLSNDTLP